MDVYLPAAPSVDAGRGTVSSGGTPVALFCHGGIWAHGERWHYAPLAARLAQAGVLTIVMSYSLYPQVLAPQQALEVGQALSWTLDNVARLGGDPGEVRWLPLYHMHIVANVEEQSTRWDELYVWL